MKTGGLLENADRLLKKIDRYSSPTTKLPLLCLTVKTEGPPLEAQSDKPIRDTVHRTVQFGEARAPNKKAWSNFRLNISNRIQINVFTFFFFTRSSSRWSLKKINIGRPKRPFQLLLELIRSDRKKPNANKKWNLYVRGVRFVDCGRGKWRIRSIVLGVLGVNPLDLLDWTGSLKSEKVCNGSTIRRTNRAVSSFW